jgi:hypothetical protein
MLPPPEVLLGLALVGAPTPPSLITAAGLLQVGPANPKLHMHVLVPGSTFITGGSSGESMAKPPLALQASQMVEPALGATALRGQSVHDFWPGFGWNLPIAHGLHSVLPSSPT